MREDISAEEKYLKQIISSCELILDDLEQGASMEQSDFNKLGYADNIVAQIQNNISKQLNPTNIQ